MKILKALFFLLILTGSSYAQKPNKEKSLNDNSEIIILKIENLEKQNADLKDEIKTTNSNLNKSIADVKSDTKEIIYTYGAIVTAVLGLLGFLINFLGKKAIKDRVEEIISNRAQLHIETKTLEVLNSKISDSIIEEVIKSKSEAQIAQLITALKLKTEETIEQIKEEGNQAINSLKSSPELIGHKIYQTQTDQEISENNLQQTAYELFSLAFEATDERLQIELYNSVLKIEPYNLHALNNLGFAYNALNKAEEAIKCFTKIIEIDSSYYKALTNRAQSYNLLGNFTAGLSDLESSLKIKNDFEYSYAVKGNILTKLGQFKEAEIELNKAVELNVNSGEAYFNRAFFYEERLNFANSLSDYEKAEQLGVINKGMLYNNMAVLFRRMKKYNKAIEYLNKARAISPEFANIDGTLALIYADQGDDDNFYKYLKIALEKGCKAWDYLHDSGFDKYRDSDRFKRLIEPFKNKALA